MRIYKNRNKKDKLERKIEKRKRSQSDIIEEH